MANKYGKYNQIQVVDYVGDIVNNEVAKQFAVSAIAKVSGTNYLVSCSRTTYLAENNYIVMEGTTNFNGVYTVSNITDTNFNITVPSEPTDETGLISASYKLSVLYVHGTYNDIYQKLNRTDKDTKAVVFALIEPFRSNVDISGGSNIYKAPVLTMFVGSAFSESWTTQDHYTNVIKPCANIFDLFANLTNIDEYTEVVHVKYGKWSLLTGHQAHLLGKVSGIEITDAELNVYFSYKC